MRSSYGMHKAINRNDPTNGTETLESMIYEDIKIEIVMICIMLWKELKHLEKNYEF